MSKFDWDKIMKEKTVVHVTTKKQAKKLCNEFKKKFNIFDLDEKDYGYYGSNTCYNFKGHGYSPMFFYKKKTFSNS